MAPATLDSLLRQILPYGAADWLYFAEVNRIVALEVSAPDDDAAIGETMQLIGHMLSEGLVVVGELPASGRNFQMWPGTTEELMDRIRGAGQSVHDSGRAINMGDVCWIAVTPRGRLFADHYRSAESR
jgi:hypothetical protein